MKGKNIAVIGGGASGMCAALETKYRDTSVNVTVFERLPKTAKKILATGNGRCNFTNEDLSPKHFYGDARFLRSVLTSPFADTENFFRSLGVLSFHEDGRIYPRSQQAVSVRLALTDKADEYGVIFKTDTAVTQLKKGKHGFTVNGEHFDAVIVSGGGKASPVHGSDGSCYGLLKNLGHTATPLYPALCGLKTDGKFLNALKGVRAECKVSLFDGSKLLGEESGEVQFTDKAISGIPVMNLSHLCENRKHLLIKLDLCEEISFSELYEHLNTLKRNSPKKETENILGGIVNSKIGFAVLNKLNIQKNAPISQIPREKLSDICEMLKSFCINISGTKGFDGAQITCGGINTDEIDPETMMSKITDGLFVCGEILDIHGDCGGYNLHLAWTTGRLAGNGAYNYLEKQG